MLLGGGGEFFNRLSQSCETVALTESKVDNSWAAKKQRKKYLWTGSRHHSFMLLGQCFPYIISPERQKQSGPLSYRTSLFFPLPTIRNLVMDKGNYV